MLIFSESKIWIKTIKREACKLEIDVKEPIGKQDQYTASYGGLNRYHFNEDGTVDVEDLNLEKDYEQIEKNLMLFHLGGSRKASSILKDQNKNLKLKKYNR